MDINRRLSLLPFAVLLRISIGIGVFIIFSVVLGFGTNLGHGSPNCVRLQTR